MADVNSRDIRHGIADMPAGADIETLPPGLYATGERGTLAEAYDPARDERKRNVPVSYLLRIDDGKSLPLGVTEAYFRKDGKRVIKMWIPWLPANPGMVPDGER